MSRPPILPRVTGVKLVGYRPLFSETISFQVKHGCFLVIGGNGLGKTTILQSIVYCLAGEADLAIDDRKSNRWGKDYFEGRLDSLTSAYVTVEFYLGETKVSLMRGFRTKGILSFTIDDNVTIDNPRETEHKFSEFLANTAGYQHINDFRFIVHKLCYLPENRANLVWDLDAQIRLLMLLFSDIIKEDDFRTRREQLKEFDSKRRHINVAINSTKKQLENLYLYSPDDSNSQEALEAEIQASDESTSTEVNDENYKNIVEKLQYLVKERANTQNKLREIRQALTGITIEIEELHEKLAKEEEAFILKQLSYLESEESRLAMYKLLHSRLCPVCGSLAEELSNKAKQNSKEGNCLLCGTKQDTRGTDNQLVQLDIDLSTKIQVRVKQEEILINLEKELAMIRQEEESLQSQYDNFRLRLPIMRPISPASSSIAQPNNSTVYQDFEKLKEQLKDLTEQYGSFDLRFEQLQSELNEEYATFNRVARNRFELLAELYSQYATEFLGIPCTLEPALSNTKFLDLTLYVPKFADKTRLTPEACSEAQRFFLDIAFRMALIALSQRLTNTAGLFICETPENALDMTYVANVAKMFARFTSEGHTLLATSNIQPGALAGPILLKYSKSQRYESVLNLLDYGKLSRVQLDNVELLRHEFERIINGDPN